jgi:hypothetical protein
MPESVVEERPNLITGVEAVRSTVIRLIASTAESTIRSSVIVTL